MILEPFNFLSSISEALIVMIMPIIVITLTIRVMWYGFETMRGQGGHNVLMEVFFKNVKPILVVSIGLTGGAYASNILPIIEELRTTLTSLFTHTSAANSYAILDSSMEKAIETFTTMTNDAWENHMLIGVTNVDLTGVFMIFCACVMFFALLLYTIVAAGQLLVIDVMFIVLFALGPIFIACFAFNATSRFFDSWLSTVLKYVFTAALIMLVVGVGNGIFDSFVTKMHDSAGFMDFIKAAAYSLASSCLLIYFTLKVPSLAGDMIGNGGISLFSPSAVAAPIGSAAKSITAPATNYVANKASSGAVVLRDMVSKVTRQNGTGSISAGDRPLSPSMQGMLDGK